MNYFSKFSFVGKQHIKDILEDVSDITDNWENLGMELGLHDTTLMKIKKESGGKVDECKTHNHCMDRSTRHGTESMSSSLEEFSSSNSWKAS